MQWAAQSPSAPVMNSISSLSGPDVGQPNVGCNGLVSVVVLVDVAVNVSVAVSVDVVVVVPVDSVISVEVGAAMEDKEETIPAREDEAEEEDEDEELLDMDKAKDDDTDSVVVIVTGTGIVMDMHMDIGMLGPTSSPIICSPLGIESRTRLSKSDDTGLAE